MLIKLLNNYILYYFLKSVYLHHVHEINGKRDIQMNLVLYTKNNCIKCKMTKRFLEQNNITFEEHNISEEPEYVDYLKEKGFQSVPVLENNSEPIINGFRPDQLKELVAAN